MKEIDIEKWNRKDIFKLFNGFENPFYAVTIPVDITEVKACSKRMGIPFYHVMIWAMTKAVNNVPVFNIRIRDGKLYQLDKVDPDFTILKKGKEVFQYMFLPWLEDINQFSKSIYEEMEEQGDNPFGNSEESDEAVYLSCTPWFDITSATNPHTKNADDTIPRIVWGKYYEENNRLMVHMSIEVNHKIIDAYHIGLLKESIDNVFESLRDM